jgi:two-component system CheB/CheR fusion protein
MAREGLMLPLREAINKAKKENQRVRKENVQLDQDGHKYVSLEVIPLKNIKDRNFLILFESGSSGIPGGAGSTGVKQPAAARGKATPRDGHALEEIAELKSELAETREYLQAIQEEHEAATEELQASNEEVQSANEELQSINEELETSKEELESTNEELITVNEEMQSRNQELNRLNSDLNNLHDSVNMSIVVLGRDLTIRVSPQRPRRNLTSWLPILAGLSTALRPIWIFRHWKKPLLKSLKLLAPVKKKCVARRAAPIHSACVLM